MEDNKKQVLARLEAVEREERLDEAEKKDRQLKSRKGVITSLAIATAILGATTVGFGIGYGVEQSNASHFKGELENVYNDNFYNLLDSVNNLENKVSKTLNATSSTYQRKTLLEASKNASEAEISIAALPLSQNDIQDTTKMVNQIAGYTSTLAEKLAKGENLSQSEIETLEKVHQNIMSLKEQLNKFERKLNDGYSILDSSLNVDANGNEFSSSLMSLKSVDIEYPTMIYDGPFSDSVVQAAVKGLSGAQVSREEARENVQTFFKDSVRVEEEGETNGKFETYNFRVTNSSEEMLFVQVTKIGGHILTISGTGEEGVENIDYNAARKIALEFARGNGIENPDVVWADSIGNDVYLNIAPTQNGIILYPDLVKVKVNTTSGSVVGYDATPYFTNHTNRKISKGTLADDRAIGSVPSTFEIVQVRWVLSPLDYNREVVCKEVQAENTEGTYYFYFNGTTGELEDVLKVVQTDNGNLLM
ncbi:MAG: germination protein YpeB [Clostridia bacterium]|nr:germination protein YpeB [Clostridia bacterium]